LRVGVFAARFSRFISLEATGATVDVTSDDGGTESVPKYVFRSVRARLHGIEVEGKKRLLASPWTLDLTGKFDATRARNADTGEALPRVAPLRVTLGLDAGIGPWSTRAEVEHAARQDRVPATDIPTDGYTIVNLALTRRFTLGESEALWFVKLNNVGNELAYSASSIQSVRELAPMPGRSLKTGVRVTF
jgi:iron complex outermembrane receptor protein